MTGKSIAVVVALLAVVGPLGITGAKAADKVTVRWSILSDDITSFCLRESIARHPDAGRFSLANEGIEVKTIKLSVSQNPVMVGTGEVDVGECAGISVTTNAFNKGAKDLFIFAAGSVKPAYVIVANKKFKSLKDLKGGKFASPGPQSTAAEAIEMMMKRAAGLLPERDYAFVSAGAGSARVAALMAGRVDAISMYAPLSYKLLDSGFVELGDELDFIPNYVSGTMISNRKWAEQHADVLVRMNKKFIEIGDWLKNPASKDEVIDWLAKNWRIGRDPIGKDYATKFYNDTIVKQRPAFDGYADAAAITANLDILAERGYLKKEDYPSLGKMVDYSYLNKALAQLGRPPVKQPGGN